MVRIHPDPPRSGNRGQVTGNSERRCKRGRARCEAGSGAVAQLGERLLCKQEAVGSIPSSSTIRDQRSGNR